jgi:hypothetical protein
LKSFGDLADDGARRGGLVVPVEAALDASHNLNATQLAGSPWVAPSASRAPQVHRASGRWRAALFGIVELVIDELA